jgi:hypothetical protein
MSKITITVSGPVGVGKSTVCAKLEILLKHLGCKVEWVGGKEEKNLMQLEDWTETPKTPIEIVERVTASRKVYETYSGQNDWLEVSQDEYDRSEGVYERRIRRVAVDNVYDMQDMPDMPRTSQKAFDAIASGDAVCVEADGCPTERAVLQRFWRAHGGRVPQLIEQKHIDELLQKHSEWTPYGFAMVDSHRHKFVNDLLALTTAKEAPKSDAVHKALANFKDGTLGEIRFLGETPMEMRLIPVDKGEEECGVRKDFLFAHLEGQEPTGYLMKHSTGPDRGFAWNKNDLQFSEDWERVGLFTEEQLADVLKRANEDYNDRAKRWRDSFDTMHRRAMKAEAQILTQEQIDAIKFAIGYLENSPISKDMVAALKTITEN